MLVGKMSRIRSLPVIAFPSACSTRYAMGKHCRSRKQVPIIVENDKAGAGKDWRADGIHGLSLQMNAKKVSVSSSDLTLPRLISDTPNIVRRSTYFVVDQR